MVEHTLEVKDLTKVFQTNDDIITAVDAVNFQLSGDEFFTMLGPSGCGKTTTLRMIAGLETCTAGNIIFDGQDYSRISTFQRNIGMVFQSYALFPHLSLFENVAYGLRIRKMSKPEIKKRIDDILKLLGLQDLSHRYPADISGGQQQRVSIARALVYDPGLLLLDEPLANLDAKLRIEMREEIRRIQKELGIMTIYVTHDQEEAMSVSDRVAIFNHGKLMQVGKPKTVYSNPASIFVSDFIGKANFFPVHIAQRDKTSAKISLNNGHELKIDRLYQLIEEEYDQIATGYDGTIMVRPEHISIVPVDDAGLMRCTIKRVQFLGSFHRYMVESPQSVRKVIVDSPREVSGIGEGDVASLVINTADAQLFYLGDRG